MVTMLIVLSLLQALKVVKTVFGDTSDDHVVKYNKLTY